MNEVPPGALISFIQKGLMYLELEANLNNVRPYPSCTASAPRRNTVLVAFPPTALQHLARATGLAPHAVGCSAVTA